MDNTDFNYLLISVKKGNRKSLATLYSLFYDNLFHYGNKLTRNEERVEDCIQNLFLKIFERRKTLGEISNVRAYIFVSFKRLLLNKSKKELTEHHMISLTNSDEIVFHEEDILEMSYNQYTIEKKLHTLLNELSSKQKEVIYLKYYNKLSSKEIAEIINTTPQVVLNLLHQSYKKLRTHRGLKELLLSFSA